MQLMRSVRSRPVSSPRGPEHNSKMGTRNDEYDEPFTYREMQEDEFRLIRLLPGNWPDPIAFGLLTFSMKPDELPFYEAVSYTWGDPSSTVLVKCGGTSMRITRSVEDLLRRFRWSDRIRCVLSVITFNI
jgi:hypothetical protein